MPEMTRGLSQPKEGGLLTETSNSISIVPETDFVEEMPSREETWGASFGDGFGLIQDGKCVCKLKACSCTGKGEYGACAHHPQYAKKYSLKYGKKKWCTINPSCLHWRKIPKDVLKLTPWSYCKKSEKTKTVVADSEDQMLMHLLSKGAKKCKCGLKKESEAKHIFLEQHRRVREAERAAKAAARKKAERAKKESEKKVKERGVKEKRSKARLAAAERRE